MLNIFEKTELKKKLKKTAVIAMAAVMMTTAAVPMTAQSVDAATTKVSGAEVPDQFKKGYDVVNCLDISRWQKDISSKDWEKIKKAGVSAVIVRAGYSSLRDNEMKPDKYFKDNINNASKAGLDVGVYYFSSAVNKDEAKAEAEYFMTLIEPYRDKITLPVVLDFESNEHGRLTARTMANIGVDGCTQMCEAFLEVVADNGYDPMIYANRATLDNRLDYKKLQEKYKIWLAQYSSSGTAPTYKGDYYMWQYSSDVRLDGIDARVDANYLFKEDASATGKVIPIDLYKDEEKADDDSKNSKLGAGLTGRLNTDEEKTIEFNVDNGVASQVPESSATDKSEAVVVDKNALTHQYIIYKTDKDNQTEATLAALLNGYFKSSHDIDPAYVKETVIPKILGQKDYAKARKDGKNVSMHSMVQILQKLNLQADYYDKIDSEIYVNIKRHLAKGMPVMVWMHSNNDKWGKNSNQIMLLVGLNVDGYAIMVDPIDRDWSKSDQRVKLVSVSELVTCMQDSKSKDAKFTGGNDGGYILISK